MEILQTLALIVISAATLVSSWIGNLDNKVWEYVRSKINEPRVGATLVVPKAVALFETTLANSIAASSTSFTLTSATDKDGNTLASSTYGFILDEGTASEEIVLADCTGTTCSNVTRGISVVTGTSSVSALQFSHSRGASIKITDAPLLPQLSRILNGEGQIEQYLRYSTSTRSFTDDRQLVNKYYADQLTVSGSPDASQTVKGIVEIATDAEVASSTSSGGTTAPLVIRTTTATDTPSSVATQRLSLLPVSNRLGFLSQRWLNLGENFAFSGASTTISGTLDVGGNATTSNATTTSLNVSTGQIRVNSVGYRYPATQAAASTTALLNNGSGDLTWNSISSISLEYLGSCTATGATSTCAITGLPNRSYYQVYIAVAGKAATAIPTLRFNADSAGNYGYKNVPDGVADAAANAQTALLVAGTNFANADTCTVQVWNRAASIKHAVWSCYMGSTTTNAGTSIVGGGQWSNTSDAIHEIVLGITQSTTMNAGTSIFVYGSR